MEKSDLEKYLDSISLEEFKFEPFVIYNKEGRQLEAF